MNIQNRSVRLGLALAGVSAVLYAAYRFWKHLHTKTIEPRAPPVEEEEEQDANLYDELVQEKEYQKMCNGRIQHSSYLSDISYRIILCLMKGSSYQGVVSIGFNLSGLTDEVEYLSVNYNGTGIKCLMVNNRRIDERDVRFIDHCIQIPRQILRERGKNQIQVIFQNQYSFLDEGLSAYFTIDEQNKYSLRQQVIYSLNGCLQVQRIIPCFNCLNECQVGLQVIHPDSFDVFSNSTKSLQQFCSVLDYQRYPFLFEHSSSLNRSFKMNSSTVSIDSSSQYSSSNFYNRKKANSHFYPSKLLSIHNLFVFSSEMIEVLPSPSNNPLQQTIMIRYFCKNSELARMQRAINKLHAYVLQVLKKLNDDNKIESYLTKIDVLIMGDRGSEGSFSTGALMLSDRSLDDNSSSIRHLYLITRAIYGMVLLAKGQNLAKIEQILKLNEMVFRRFQQFRNFLYLANQQHHSLKALLTNSDKKAYINANEGYVLSYFHKQIKFIVLGNITQSLSFEFHHLMSSFRVETTQQFWETLLANYNFLSPLIIDPLLKLALAKLGMPSEERLRQQLKICFNSSKFALAFYTNKQLQDNLPKFMEYQAEGLQQRLPQLKVKQKFKDYITQKYEKYLPVKSNIAEAEILYNQFKKFNQSKNFHHYSLLESQISRVQCFGDSFIKSERISAECSLSGWRLLSRLRIYPLNEQYYGFLQIAHDIQQK